MSPAAAEPEPGPRNGAVGGSPIPTHPAPAARAAAPGAGAGRRRRRRPPSSSSASGQNHRLAPSVARDADEQHEQQQDQRPEVAGARLSVDAGVRDEPEARGQQHELPAGVRARRGSDAPSERRGARVGETAAPMKLSASTRIATPAASIRYTDSRRCLSRRANAASTSPTRARAAASAPCAGPRARSPVDEREHRDDPRQRRRSARRSRCAVGARDPRGADRHDEEDPQPRARRRASGESAPSTCASRSSVTKPSTCPVSSSTCW